MLFQYCPANWIYFCIKPSKHKGHKLQCRGQSCSSIITFLGYQRHLSALLTWATPRTKQRWDKQQKPATDSGECWIPTLLSLLATSVIISTYYCLSKRVHLLHRFYTSLGRWEVLQVVFFIVHIRAILEKIFMTVCPKPPKSHLLDNAHSSKQGLLSFQFGVLDTICKHNCSSGLVLLCRSLHQVWDC